MRLRDKDSRISYRASGAHISSCRRGSVGFRVVVSSLLFDLRFSR